MKRKISKDTRNKILYIIGGIFLFIVIMNYLVLPWYVSGDEIKVPKVVGLSEEEAEELLSDNDLNPIIGGVRFDERYTKGKVIFQKPAADSWVKEGRRVFLFVSGGVPLIKVPLLRGKALRDAKFTLERMDLILGDTVYTESEEAEGIIISQQYSPGAEVKKGTRINVTLSSGPTAGLIMIPDVVGKSLSQAENIITENGLTVGKINYQPSFSLLPNTVIDQYPAKDSYVEEGSTVDLFVTKNVETPDEIGTD